MFMRLILQGHLKLVYDPQRVSWVATFPKLGKTFEQLLAILLLTCGQAQVKRRPSHMPNLKQMSQNNRICSLALDSAHVRLDVCPRPKKRVVIVSKEVQSTQNKLICSGAFNYLKPELADWRHYQNLSAFLRRLQHVDKQKLNAITTL